MYRRKVFINIATLQVIIFRGEIVKCEVYDKIIGFDHKLKIKFYISSIAKPVEYSHQFFIIACDPSLIIIADFSSYFNCK